MQDDRCHSKNKHFMTTSNNDSPDPKRNLDDPAPPTTYVEMWWFFFPLALTFSLITFSHTFVNNALSKLPNPEAALAGYAVARSIMQLAQNPTMMVRQVVTTLVVDESSFRLVRSVVYRLMFFMAGAIAVLGWTPLGGRLLQAAMGLEGEALQQAVVALRVFAVFPFFSVNRNMGQGLAILARANHLVPFATVMRIATLVGLLALFVHWRPLPGAALGALAFTMTMLVEAAMLFWVSRPARRQLRRREVERERLEQAATTSEAANRPVPTASSPLPPRLTTRQVLNFYVPLMGTTLVAALTIPLVQSGISRTGHAEIQIAAFAVTWAMSMVITSPAGMLHQASLTFTQGGNALAYSRSARFALGVGIVFSTVTAFIAFTPVGGRLLASAGATPQLLDTARRTLQVLALLPLIRAWREHCWGVLMQKRETTSITRGKTINIITTLTILVGGLLFGVQETAVLGAWSLVIGETVEGFILHRRLTAVLPRGYMAIFGDRSAVA